MKPGVVAIDLVQDPVAVFLRSLLAEDWPPAIASNPSIMHEEQVRRRSPA